MRYFFQHSREEINDMIEENEKAMLEVLNQISPLPITDLTGEEKAMLISGEITIDEAVSIIMERLAEQTDVNQDRIAELIARAYVLRAYYTGELEAMRRTALAEYSALDPADRTSAMKSRVGLRYFNDAGTLENECDALMDELVKELETEVRRVGGDLSLINRVKVFYAQEKSLKKAYYLSLYN
jgi:hypothetical protein